MPITGLKKVCSCFQTGFDGVALTQNNTVSGQRKDDPNANIKRYKSPKGQKDQI